MPWESNNHDVSEHQEKEIGNREPAPAPNTDDGGNEKIWNRKPTLGVRGVAVIEGPQ